jgi:type VI secretion system secreted protein VgrG
VSPHLPAEAVQVASFKGTEAVSEPYRFDLVCRASMSADAVAALEMKLPGSRASLGMAAASQGTRWVHGVVTALEIERSLHDAGVELHARIEPRLSLLDLTSGSAIHQDASVPEVVKSLLDGWGIPHDARLDATYRKRVYLTQHEETDLAFLQRILAGEGIFFFFEQPELSSPDEPAEERVVICDSAGLYAPIPGDAHLRFAEAGGGLEAASLFDHVTRFGRRRQLMPQRVMLGDFDHRNPGLPQQSSAKEENAPEVPSEPHQLRAYHHPVHAEIESTSGDAELDAQHAQAVLEQHRVDALRATGQSHSRRLSPGASFVLEGHAVEHLNGAYAVTRVEHEGRVPELTGGDTATVIYENRFACVPDSVPMRPLPPPRLRRQVAETATVVGPGGEDIHTDDLGRVKVKFHWDLSEVSDDKASCWLRVAQAWAGTHFGAQFVPRVGDEVIVTFLGGDVDRPIITGSVYNGTHPNPFDLPEQKTTSGFRTQSTPGGSGYNELSFCDQIGEERIYLRAERDLVEEVENDHQLKVKRHQTLSVSGAQTFTVAEGQTMQIGGAQIVNVAGSQQLMATGSGLLAYGGDADIQVSRQLTTRVDGRERREIRGQSNALFRDDCVTKVLGHHTTIVGEHDARRAFNVHVEGTATHYASGSMQLSSEKDIELRVGDSVVRITEEGIEMSGPKLRVNGDAFELRAGETLVMEAPDQVTLKSDKVLMESESAFLGLGKVAKLKGELVKLNCEDDPVDDLDPPEEPKLTTIVLNDEDGKPIPNQRFVLVMPDGSERTGTLDEEGKAELEVPESGDIIFPDVHNPRPS